MRTPPCMQDARMRAEYWRLSVLATEEEDDDDVDVGADADACMSLRRQTPPPSFCSRTKVRLRTGEVVSRRKRRMCSS